MRLMAGCLLWHLHSFFAELTCASPAEAAGIRAAITAIAHRLWILINDFS
jgi:hypothetical protein